MFSLVAFFSSCGPEAAEAYRQLDYFNLQQQMRRCIPVGVMLSGIFRSPLHGTRARRRGNGCASAKSRSGQPPAAWDAKGLLLLLTYHPRTCASCPRCFCCPPGPTTHPALRKAGLRQQPRSIAQCIPPSQLRNTSLENGSFEEVRFRVGLMLCALLPCICVLCGCAVVLEYIMYRAGSS